ncbi:hypothetical protein MKW94_029121 [Papaver nudicaule]|uniref:Uncharacterized protein n=1 Tax=Papaver nudicaule TaxID=74823 RepID=A0AA42AZF9_PAPNU|nr:hypothetical protein [Papaver nudicaule]
MATATTTIQFQLLRPSSNFLLTKPSSLLISSSTPKTHLTQFLNHIHSPSKSIYSHLRSLSSSSKPRFSASDFGGFNQKTRRGFCSERRGGIVAMAGGQPVQKSEDEWRAVLSPEQFRILRQKGTESSIRRSCNALIWVPISTRVILHQCPKDTNHEFPKFFLVPPRVVSHWKNLCGKTMVSYVWNFRKHGNPLDKYHSRHCLRS